MSKWRNVKLTDIANLITKGTTPTTLGFEFQDEGINFIKIESISESGEFIRNKFEHISYECDEKLKRSRLQEDDILFSIAGALGRSAIVKNNILPANTNQALSIIRLIDKIDPRYVQLSLKSVRVYHQFQMQKQGLAQLNLSLKNIGDLEIPLPPLETQKQIASILDQASDLISLHKKQLEELDDLIKSVFYDMFGDPILNNRDWNENPLGELLFAIDSGKSPICHEWKAVGNQWGVLKLSAVTGGTYKSGENKALPLSNEPNPSLEVKYMDLLVTRKNTRELVGSCAYVHKTRKRLLLPDTIFRLVTKPEVSKIFIWALFNSSFKIQIQSLASGTAGSMPNISKTKLSQLKIPVPHPHLQTQFATIVEKIEEQKALVQKALDESQYLFDSLMDKYFGE